jgi:hypothetical protein
MATPQRGTRRTLTRTEKSTPAVPAYVKLPQLAAVLGLDRRTLGKYLAGQPFVHRLGRGTFLVERGAFETWWAARRW